MLVAKDEAIDSQRQYFIILVAKDEVIDSQRQYFIILVAKDGVPDHPKSIFHYTSCKTRDFKAREPIKKGSRLKK